MQREVYNLGQFKQRILKIDPLCIVQVIKEGYAQAVKDKGAYEDINRRAIQAERMRDELLVKVDNLTSSLRREEMKQVTFT